MDSEQNEKEQNKTKTKQKNEDSKRIKSQMYVQNKKDNTEIYNIIEER